MKCIARFLAHATRSRSVHEDRARREFIFNVLVLGAIILLFVGIVDDVVHHIFSDPAIHQSDSLSSIALYVLFAFFAGLYALSIRGRAALASYFLLAALFDLAAYMGYRWGVDLAASILFYALVITMAGILISAQFAFAVAILAGTAIGLTVHLQHIGSIQPDRSWIGELWKTDDVIVATLLFLVIATVMWLSNREIEKSLARARRSEADLKQERDLLEVRVEERTLELRQAELERMSQAYRFVEFGRLAGGIFHDLMNPLAGLTLNIDRIANPSVPREALSDDVQRAKRAAMHMQNLLLSMRRHLVHEQSRELFSLKQVVTEALQLVGTYAQKHHVRCRLNARGDAQLYGDPVAFTQVITNLVNNAIQAHPAVDPGKDTREINVTIASTSGNACIEVRDSGHGIPEDTLAHIFEAYFTTKGSEYGIGLGLSIAKRIVEKEFGGTISVDSNIGEGTVFAIYVPIREP